MLKEILIISLLVNYSLAACTADSTAETSTDTAGTNNYAAGKCCWKDGSVQVFDVAKVVSCAARASGTSPEQVAATGCKANHSLSAGGVCAACTGSQVAGEGNTGACAACPTGTTTCSATGTAAASFVFTAITCAAGYLQPATGPCTMCPTGQGSSAANTSLTCVSCGNNVATCQVAAGSNGANGAVSQVLTCQPGFALKDAVSPSTIQTCEALPATATAGCTLGTITGAGNTFACTECGADGYATGAPSGSPTATCATCTVTANCGACGATAGGACTQCKAGFRNSAAADAALTCAACVEGCASCPDASADAAKCSTVKPGWQLSAAAPATPVQCGGDGKTSTTATSIACDVACPANCATCNTDATKCEVCNADFELAADGTCGAIAAADRHLTCASASKKASADHCLSCVAADFRAIETEIVAPATTATPKAVGKCMCMTGYAEAATVAQACISCGENAATCTINATGGITITACKPEFFIAGKGVVGNKCLAKALTGQVGLWWDSVQSEYAACHATCSKCTAGTDSSCSECLTPGTSWAAAPAEDAAGYDTYLKAYWLNASQCFNVCPTDYVADEAQTACVAGSAGNSIILSIALVLTIIVSILF